VADVIERLRGGLIVSCQAPPGSPLRDPSHLAALAAAAEQGGAVAIRAEGGDSIRAIKAAVSVPVIGLRKREVPDSPVYIVPELRDAEEVVEAGADMLAVDATLRERPGGVAMPDFLRELRATFPGVPLMADVDEERAGIAARGAGADVLATTLSGYTQPEGGPTDGPDLDLVALLAHHLDCPVIAEGRYGSPGDVAAAFAAGAWAVVVGTAITDALALTRRFAAAAPGPPPDAAAGPG
jgi:N-acylglucosamine-6-phosphate 2-epimerase